MFMLAVESSFTERRHIVNHNNALVFSTLEMFGAKQGLVL